MKKQIPLYLRLELDKIEKKHPGLLKVELIKAVGTTPISIALKEKNDPGSPFRFRIFFTSKPYKVSFKPKDKESLSSEVTSIETFDEVIYKIDHWVDLLNMYNSHSVMFDDSITQSYYEEIESNFQILDEDAKTSPYKFSQQKALMQIFEKIKGEVEQAKKGENDVEAELILNEIKNAQENLGKETKWKVVERLRKIVAMCMKHGYELGIKALEAAVITEILKLVGM